MTDKNFMIINKFFYSYSMHDMPGIKEVVSDRVKWTFPGHNPISGEKSGIDELIEFFNKLNSVLGSADIFTQNIVLGVNDDNVLECQHIKTHREDGNNFDQEVCILWKFSYGKIIEGRHFMANIEEADEFFNNVFLELSKE